MCHHGSLFWPTPLRPCLTWTAHVQKGTLQNRAESGAKVLTLTGWVAVVAMFGLATATIGGGIYLVRRLTGHSRGYTMVLKHAPASEG